jgi:hypothetical protein
MKTATPPLNARLAAIREQLRTVLPEVRADLPLQRALRHAQTAVEARLGLPREAPTRKASHRPKRLRRTV